MAKQASKRQPETDHESALGVDLGWYKDAIIYQLHVRSFRDSDADVSRAVVGTRIASSPNQNSTPPCW